MSAEGSAGFNPQKRQMNKQNSITNVVVAGLGGQGVLKASDILADAAFRSGLDVKKSEVHGMSQRGGSVYSDVRFGPKVFSPMVPPGEADFLVVLTADQIEPNRHLLKPDVRIIGPDAVAADRLPNRKSLNVALLGVLSGYLAIPEEFWVEAMRANLPEKFFDSNQQAFKIGRQQTTTNPESKQP
jgi:indolepyruvate ferredoxin oxidoreductase beta subunit